MECLYVGFVCDAYFKTIFKSQKRTGLPGFSAAIPQKGELHEWQRLTAKVPPGEGAVQQVQLSQMSK